ncbi:MAG: type 1 glutamine amidotransferase domain-containing protein [Myxococcales bacterium]|nr:type 1 glutamine amidotransferase domain-containing protein [Myxococcales bacterium]
MTQSPRILLVVTSHSTLGDTGRKTGLWLEEVAVPYRTFAAAGAHVDIASPAGGPAPVDPQSARNPQGEVAAFLADPTATAKLEQTLRVDAVGPDYDAVFLAGGHGVMWDLVEEPALSRLIAQAFDAGKVVAAVCHGLAALVGVTLGNGAPLVRGRRVTGFTNDEEEAVGLRDVVPFLLETQLRALGAEFHGGERWAPHTVRDGRLVTGQNPRSSAGTARQVLEALRA